jgi:hypothetical protein
MSVQLKVTDHVMPPILAGFRRRHGQPVFISAKVGTVCHCIDYDCIARRQVQIFQYFRNFFYGGYRTADLWCEETGLAEVTEQLTWGWRGWLAEVTEQLTWGWKRSA